MLLPAVLNKLKFDQTGCFFKTVLYSLEIILEILKKIAFTISRT